MVMVCEQLALFPQTSVAVQVRTIVFGQLPEVVAVKVTGILPSQFSFAVTFAGAGTSPRHCTVASVGHPLKTGLVVSLTTIICEHVALLPQSSAATQVRIIVAGQNVPDVTALN